ncbi:MAG: hypothetical protein FJ291_03135 [Planctomycetes bacterium]|nr:hypothetical protein [Planctomycetota bacterium]
MDIKCNACQAVLVAPDSLVGKSGKCPKCGVVLQISDKTAAPVKKKEALPTIPQIEYARSLGIDVPPNVSRRELSALIGSAVDKRDEERLRKLNELQDRESKASEDMRAEILAEIDEEDCRLSEADPGGMAQELGRRGLAALVVTFDARYINLEKAGCVPFKIAFSENMTEQDVRKAFIVLGAIAQGLVPG